MKLVEDGNKLYNKLERLIHKYELDKITKEEIELELPNKCYNDVDVKICKFWYEFFKCVGLHWGWNIKTIDDLFCWTEFNWKRLHETADEQQLSKYELLKMFLNEIEYIYDRMELGRLFRTHWIYSNYYNRILYKDNGWNNLEEFNNILMK